MIRRIAKWAATAVVAGGIAVAGYLGIQELAEDEDVEETSEEFALGSSIAEVRTLSQSHEVEGSIDYDTSLPLMAPIDGIVLEAAEPTAAVESGDVLARVDEAVVVWLDGEIPAWRTMQSGDTGPDVEQLEHALVGLGFDPDGDVVVDEEFDSATVAMVEAWQESIDVEPTGVVELGSVVFGGVRDRVTNTAAGVGSSVQVGDEMLSIDTGTRIVTFAITPAQAVDLAPGDTVSVELPDGSDVEATIESEFEGLDAVTVVARFGSDVELPSRDSVAVDVSWDHAVVEDAVTIPSSAQHPLDHRTDVVAAVMADGSRDRRQVELGTSVGTRTEILLGLATGDEVIVL